MGRKTKKIYLFDFGGTLIKAFNGGRVEVSKFIGKKVSVIDTALQRNGIIDRKYYVSYNKDFNIPKNGHNPLFSKSPYKYKGKGRLWDVFLTDDF